MSLMARTMFLMLAVALLLGACESGTTNPKNDNTAPIDTDTAQNDTDDIITDDTVTDDTTADNQPDLSEVEGTDQTDQTITDDIITDDMTADDLSDQTDQTDQTITDDATDEDETVTDDTVTDDAADVDVPDIFVDDLDTPDTDTVVEEKFCDVVYRFYDGATPLGRFHNVKTGTGSRNTMENAGINGSSSTQSGPFNDTSAWPGGFVRLRFTANEAGDATAENPDVQLIEYYLPIEFVVSTMGTNVTTNVDHSLGLLGLTDSGCLLNADFCLPENDQITLDRQCVAVATGQATGDTVAWNACDVPNYPGAHTSTSTNPNNDRMNWTSADAQVSGDALDSAGCGHNMSSIGNVSCSGTFCGLVPAGTLGVQNNTWDQVLPAFSFSSTAYESARVTIPEFIIPDEMSDVYSGVHVDTGTGSAVASHMECGTLAEITCDEN